jgi:hypothetical protein
MVRYELNFVTFGADVEEVTARALDKVRAAGFDPDDFEVQVELTPETLVDREYWKGEVWCHPLDDAPSGAVVPRLLRRGA